MPWQESETTRSGPDRGQILHDKLKFEGGGRKERKEKEEREIKRQGEGERGKEMTREKKGGRERRKDGGREEGHFL